MAVHGRFLSSEMIINIVGDKYGSILNGDEYGSLHLYIFGVLHFLGFNGGWGGLGVLATYKINRGIKLVLGRVNDWVQGGFQSI